MQLLRALTDLTVIATASRPETQDWVRECGAHHVIDHRQSLAPQVEALGLGAEAADNLQGYEQGWDVKHLVALRAIVETAG